jgi:hypothetical protein
VPRLALDRAGQPPPTKTACGAPQPPEPLAWPVSRPWSIGGEGLKRLREVSRVSVSL